MRRGAILVALGVSYPVIVAAGVVTGSELLKFGGLAVLLLILLLPGLARGGPLSWLCAIAGVIGLGVAARAHLVMLPLLVTPVVIPAAVAWAFGRTLLGGRTPLISQIVQLLHPPDDRVDPAILEYARRLTWTWTLLLAALAVANAALGALMTPGGFCNLIGMNSPIPVPQSVWALFTNVFGYVIVGVFFLAEYAYRRRRFPVQPYSDFADFLRRSVALAPRLSRRGAAAAASTNSDPPVDRY
jgi:uncharacterized membrane protein